MRFFVDEEKKIVICKLENCSNELICDVCHKGWPGHEALVIADEFTGKAQCSPNETFNVEIGKKIAYKRAVAKLSKAKRRALLNFMAGEQKGFNLLINDMNKLINGYENVVNRKDKDIERILNEAE